MNTVCGHSNAMEETGGYPWSDITPSSYLPEIRENSLSDADSLQPLSRNQRKLLERY